MLHQSCSWILKAVQAVHITTFNILSSLFGNFNLRNDSTKLVSDGFLTTSNYSGVASADRIGLESSLDRVFSLRQPACVSQLFQLKSNNASSAQGP